MTRLMAVMGLMLVSILIMSVLPANAALESEVNIPFVSADAQQKSDNCPLTPHLIIGQQAIITDSVPNPIRSEPYLSATEYGQIPAGDIFTVIDGPVCSPEGWNFWRVEYNSLIGWISEGNTLTYWAEPLIAQGLSIEQPIYCPLTPRLAPGRQAIIADSAPNTLRSEPSSSAPALGQIPVDGIFTVIDGPICGPEGWFFWQVEYNNLTGWTAEGNTVAYWTAPLVSDGPFGHPDNYCPLTPRLAIGLPGILSDDEPNTLRSGPSSSSMAIGQIPVGGVFTVIGGPVCGPEGWYFWQVEYNGVVGWTAEGNTVTYWTDTLAADGPFSPSTFCPLMPRLTAGTQAQLIDDEPNTIRSEPSSFSAAIGQIPVGGVFTVISGPICGPEGWYFWQIEYNGVVGWTAEGNTVTYWLEPLG